MTRAKPAKAQGGFTLLELLVAGTIFLLVAGTTFALLGTAQKRYQTDSRILTSFQEARLGIRSCAT